MNLDKIGYGENPENVTAIIEIPYGSNIKYEVEKDTYTFKITFFGWSAMSFASLAPMLQS